MFKRYFIHSAAAVLIGLPLAASAAQPVIENWVGEMKGKGLDGQALLDEARALINKYTAK